MNIKPDCDRHQLKEGVSQFWLKFMTKVRSERMKKSNKDGQMAGQTWGYRRGCQ